VSFANTLDSGWFVFGKNVQLFKNEYGLYCDNNNFVALASGLDASLLSLKTLDLQQGSEVIAPSNTYIATILAVIQSRLKPIIVEPNLATYSIDPDKIEEKINKKTQIFDDFGAFSFYLTKNIEALGDVGGTIVKLPDHDEEKLYNYGSEVKHYKEL
jgi:dTDP-4-amino-4,6-dideoxygalactose transaminase